MAEHKSLAEALSAAQGEMENVGMDGQANYGKYMTLPALINAVRPVLARHGLAWSALPSIGEHGQPTMRYQLLHSSGEVIAGEMALMLDKQNAQGQGSALTYARRYSLAAVLNIGADEDDDGHQASRPRQQSHDPAQHVLDENSVDEVLAAIGRAKMGSKWVRLKLEALGVDVPEGQLTRGTIQRMTPEQALQMVMACDQAAEEKAQS